MHARIFLLFASVILPIIAAPVPTTDEVSNIERRSALSLDNLNSEFLKREPINEILPSKASYDIFLEGKREESSAVDDDEDDSLGDDEDDSLKVDVNTVENLQDDVSERRGLRGTGGSGGHKRGLRGTGGSGGHKRGLRGTGGSGGHKRGLRGTGGSGGHKRGLRGTGGSGGHKRSLFDQIVDSIFG